MKTAVSLILPICGLLAGALPLLLPIARNLEYEYATLCAFAVVLLLPLGASFCKPHYSTRSFGAAVLGSLLLTFLPGWLLYRFDLCPCVERDFQFWWLLQVGPHFLLALAASCFILEARRQGIRKSYLYFLIVMAALLAHVSWIIWAYPQKRITHLLSGFIHGAIYDNGIFIDQGILWARGTHALIAAGFIFALGPWPRFLRATGTTVTWVFAIYSSIQASTFPSMNHGLDALNAQMPETMESQLFTLHYRQPENPDMMKHVRAIFESAEFHSKDIAEQLLAYDTHVQIYVYPSRREKKLWFGGDGTDITDVRTPSVHINIEGWPHSTLRHELVHAMASSFAFYGLGFHPNMAFTEGLAVALAPSEDEVSLHGGASNILRSQRLPDPHALFSPLFWGESGRRAYTVAGSILKFLLDRFGIPKVKSLYAGESWAKVFGKESDPIVDDWMHYLQQNYPAPASEIAEEALFRYPGLLQDVCPHAKSFLADNSDDVFIRWRRPDSWVPSRDYWTWRKDLSNEPATRYQLIRSEALKAVLGNHIDEAEALLAKVRGERRNPPKVLEDVEFFLLETDLLIALKQRDEAIKGLKDYLDKLHAYRIGDAYTRQLWSRYLILNENPRSGDAWLSLLAGRSSHIPSRRATNKSWIVDYLFLRNYDFRPEDKNILVLLERLKVPVGIPKTFAIEWYHNLGKKWFAAGEYEKAEENLTNAAEIAPEGQKESLALYAREARSHVRKSKKKNLEVH